MAMKFWKEHAVLRVVLIAAFFVAGLTFIMVGKGMTGQMTGVLLMLAGLVLLLAALWLYNQPFADPKEKKNFK